MAALFKKYLQKAKVELAKEQLSTALTAINSALHLKAHDLEALRCKVDILRQSGDFEAAASCLMAGLKSHPHLTWWLLELAELLINRLEQPTAALEWLERVFRSRHSTDVEERRAFRLKAEALIDQDRLYEAWLVLRKATHTHTEDIDLLFLRGWVTLQMGRYCASASTFQKILRQKHDHSDAHYYLGVAYEGMGESSLMMRQFELTHQLDRILPPEIRLSCDEFRQLAEQAVQELGDEIPSIRLKIQDYPTETILKDYPHDPRRMGWLQRSKLYLCRVHSPELFFEVFQWNVERFCFTPREVVEEIKVVLQQELADFQYLQPHAVNSF